MTKMKKKDDGDMFRQIVNYKHSCHGNKTKTSKLNDRNIYFY